MRALIVTPAPPGDRSGNRITALRWAAILRSLGHRVRIAQAFTEEECDVMIALHGTKSHASIDRFKRESERPLILALTGTDIYRELEPETRHSFELADRLVALQPRAIQRLPHSLQSKARAIFQSATTIDRSPSNEPYVAVVGHLRAVKDPFRAAEAARLLPQKSRLTVLHVGRALDPEQEERALREMRENERYRWLGSIPRREVRELIAKSRALILSSLAEGGANVVSEAIRAGVPVIASAIDGTIGQLGEDYRGYFQVGDTRGLAELMLRIEEGDFLADQTERLARLFAPERERELWANLLAEVGGVRSRLAIEDLGAPRNTFREDVLAGLSMPNKRLSCQYFYDEEGSRLFQQICTLPEYYIPRAEREILELHRHELVSLAPVDPSIVELGSGDSAKTRIILDAFHRRYGSLRYLPIDIARPILEESARALLTDFGSLEVHAIAGDYHPALLELPRELPKLILFLGSNIGNFDRPEAASFLASIRERMSEPDLLLVGIDLRKDRSILEPAYDDPKGVTREFNLNLLRRIQRELGADLDPGAFAHRAEYQEREGRIAMYLESVRAQTLHLGDRTFRFTAGERIHTEFSYKYSEEEIDDLARVAGLQILRRWTDSRNLFASIVLSR